MLNRNLWRVLTLTILMIGSQAVAIFAQHPCDAFVNVCTIPSSFSSWTVNDTIVSSTGQTGEPVAHTFYTTAQNPLQTNWYHWTAPMNGMVVVNTAGTNPNAAPPSYTHPFVIDTTIAVYTGATLTTLTRIDESDDWQPSSPPNSSCTFPRTFPESIFSSCMMFTVAAGTTYHFQVDYLSGPDPLNRDFDLNLYYRAPSSAEVSVSGRVTDSNGQGVAKAIISMTDMNGTVRTTLSSTFGYYRFDGIPVGQSYTLQAVSKRYEFANNPRLLNITDDVLDEDFFSSGK